MGFLSNLFVSEKELIKIIVDCVEGVISINEFQEQFNTNKKLRKILDRPIHNDKLYHLNNYNQSIAQLFLNDGYYKNRNWDTLDNRSRVQGNLIYWLDANDIKYTEYKKYFDDWNFIFNIQPDWLDLFSHEEFCEKLLAVRPSNLSNDEQLKWGENQIAELFKYDTTHPKWVDFPAWPIVKGKPLVFSHQEKDNSLTIYYFYDPESKKEVKVKQKKSSYV